eukprot:4423154-Karenia_brevis.AAC.1
MAAIAFGAAILICPAALGWAVKGAASLGGIKTKKVAANGQKNALAGWQVGLVATSGWGWQAGQLEPR